MTGIQIRSTVQIIVNTPDLILSQKAFVFDKVTNAEWRIQPFWPLKFAYLIMDVAPDYSYTVIGVPNGGHVWIMARTKKVDPDTYEKVVEGIRAQHFDISEHKKVPQKD